MKIKKSMLKKHCVRKKKLKKKLVLHQVHYSTVRLRLVVVRNAGFSTFGSNFR